MNRNEDQACHVCGKPALAGVTTNEGLPVCYRHALAHMDVPLGEGEEEKACRACRRVIRDLATAAYLEDAGFYHEKCLKDRIKSIGSCPKCHNNLYQGDCTSCWGGIAKWIEQAKKDAQTVLASEGERICALCLRHNRLIGPGYPFFPIERPLPGTNTCSQCFAAICDDHTAHLPKGNVLGISPADKICGHLPYRGKGTTCEGKLEHSVGCSVEGCRADRSDSYEPLLQAVQCPDCGKWVCGEEHTVCPDCKGVPCDDCKKIQPKDSLLRFEEDAYHVLELCEECFEKREEGEREASWGSWLKGDYKSGLQHRFEAEGLNLDLDGVESEDLEALFNDTRAAKEIDWEGTEIDWRAAVMCTPVSAILALRGAELGGSPVSPHMPLSRAEIAALDRVASLEADWRGGCHNNYRVMEDRLRALKEERPDLASTRGGRAKLRESLRRTMRTGGGPWATPEQRKLLKSIPRTVEGMREVISMSDALRSPREADRRSSLIRAARRERNPRHVLDERNRLSHGFYQVSDETARRLAADARKTVPAREKLAHLRDPSDRTMLPSAGYELLVECDGELCWLARTPHQGRSVWSVRRAHEARRNPDEDLRRLERGGSQDDLRLMADRARRGLCVRCGASDTVAGLKVEGVESARVCRACYAKTELEAMEQATTFQGYLGPYVLLPENFDARAVDWGGPVKWRVITTVLGLPLALVYYYRSFPHRTMRGRGERIAWSAIDRWQRPWFGTAQYYGTATRMKVKSGRNKWFVRAHAAMVKSLQDEWIAKGSNEKPGGRDD